MVKGCSSPDCQKRVDEMHRAVFKDEEGGCRFDINAIKLKLKGFVLKKGLTKWMLVIIVSLGVPAYIAFINVWAEDKVTPHKYAKKEEVQEVRLEVTRLDEKYEHIKAQLQDLSRKQDEHTKTVLEAIKEINNK